MEVFQRFELTPTDGHKSFYGKCYVLKAGPSYTLYSYRSKIITYNSESGDVTEHYYTPHSRTTNRHIKAFKQFIEGILGVTI